MSRPPVLPVEPPTSMPSTFCSASARSRNWRVSSSWRVITEMEAGASLSSCSKPVALTTTSRSCCSAGVWANRAGEKRDAAASASTDGRGRRPQRENNMQKLHGKRQEKTGPLSDALLLRTN
ncbi:hypothetical protein D9M68_771400 [compost metagenome]